MPQIPTLIKEALPHRAVKYLAVRYDPAVRMHYYTFEGRAIYVSSRDDFSKEKIIRWLAQNIYFAKYLPRPGDTVIDFGAGYGEEAVYLSNRVPHIRYIGVEIQPTTFECLSMTFSKLRPEDYVASPCVISNNDFERLLLTPHYLCSGLTDDGQIVLPSSTWADFRRRYHITTIDLLKMNIEGAELLLLQSIGDLGLIKNVIVSCHDFLGRPETMTKQAVSGLLCEQGFQIQTFHHGIQWADDWLFASRADHDSR